MISLPKKPPFGSPKLLWGHYEIWPDWSSSQPHKLQKHLGLSPQPPSFFLAGEAIYFWIPLLPVISSQQQPKKYGNVATLLRPSIPNMTWLKEKHDWHGEWLSKTFKKSHPFYQKNTSSQRVKQTNTSLPLPNKKNILCLGGGVNFQNMRVKLDHSPKVRGEKK